MAKLDIIICLGKSINKDGSLDRILSQRVELAFKLATKNNIPLILSGGKSHKRFLEKFPSSESSAMLSYLKQNYPETDLNVILEEKGESTIHQLCIIKNKLLIPKKYFRVGLVTDEIHIKRAIITTEWILGDQFKIVGFGSPLTLRGKGREKFISREEEKYDLTINKLFKKYQKGDDRGLLEFDKRFRVSTKKHIKSGGNPNTILHKIT
ncbi:hypothetical protein A3A76_04880 [Candidatus Woesebacteria bacterium RIFCSPLOWO2_01_FULL_39_23]|uniref:DUF218 domain-containing protein n=2 Tax=Microgenomates group TaxID=1794810 RepID=A0A0H4T3J8_9BACT|nr:hypothetical protein [uncultured Microgenomates bacterium Rifle_16ft_4_minimus_37633]OGM13817.1 MAG: hypothetical protein A2141_04105 [Candidatus Woesebacteria bacterium RBG_16_40_11]OGM27767.1 MAG: hypothetical protein A2628_05100 [Candidatus Woesebacteria bacterium RIFCSPHIGHO2_01_FULL_40_22]OGM62189.1 MAG: hypothetical protein A3A76_04880 [Candidatus Woesebacteria bacterium RIFCSPLOWO2_01_FULL_39_23]